MGTSTVVVFGGSGFVGRHLVEKLVVAGHYVIVPTRRREQVKAELIVMPNTDVVACEPFEPRSLAKLLERADVVINLSGILHEARRHGFETVHVENVRRLVDTLGSAANVRQLIHVSSINAAPGAPSRYLRSKGKGESFITKMGKCDWTIIRPSVVFGQGDNFLGLFSRLLRLFPVMLVPMPDARFQPIWVDDLATMIFNCIGRPHAFGKILTACGPQTYSLRELIDMLMECAGPHRPSINCGPVLSKMLALVLENVPFLSPMLTRDNLASMTLPSVCEGAVNDALTLVPGELTDVREYLLASRGQNSHIETYSTFRHSARRS